MVIVLPLQRVPLLNTYSQRGCRMHNHTVPGAFLLQQPLDMKWRDRDAVPWLTLIPQTLVGMG